MRLIVCKMNIQSSIHSRLDTKTSFIWIYFIAKYILSPQQFCWNGEIAREKWNNITHTRAHVKLNLVISSRCVLASSAVWCIVVVVAFRYTCTWAARRACLFFFLGSRCLFRTEHDINDRIYVYMYLWFGCIVCRQLTLSNLRLARFEELLRRLCSFPFHSLVIHTQTQTRWKVRFIY